MELLGLYAGIVERNSDPERLGRLKVRVPHVYGIVGSPVGAIPVDDLPWALPYGLPAGGTSASGGVSWLPELGDQVLVQFLDGEPEKPVWTWFVQTKTQAEKLKLHHYKQDKNDVGPPDRGILSRYGHSLEMTETTVTLTTSQGYQIRLDNSNGTTGGSAVLQTPAGQRVELNDLRKTIVVQGLDSTTLSAGSVVLNAASNALIRAAGNLVIMVGGTLITIQEKSVVFCTGTGASLVIDANGNVAILSAGGASISVEKDTVQASTSDGTGVVVEPGKLSISAQQAVINTSALAVGIDAKYPVMMLTPSLLQWVLSHTHLSSTPGSPTGPPIPLDVAFPANSGSTRMKLT